MEARPVNWNEWQPTEEATLMFVVCDGQILLIHKKRGIGAGKINGPGGRCEPGESPLDCAIREFEEELLASPLDVEPAGVLRFQFLDGLAMRVHVFRGSDVEGTPRETDEAVPLWVSTDAIPYAQMWADDQYWMPMLLAGEYFEASFVFDKDRLVDHFFEIAGSAST